RRVVPGPPRRRAVAALIGFVDHMTPFPGYLIAARRSYRWRPMVTITSRRDAGRPANPAARTPDPSPLAARRTTEPRQGLARPGHPGVRCATWRHVAGLPP